MERRSEDRPMRKAREMSQFTAAKPTLWEAGPASPWTPMRSRCRMPTTCKGNGHYRQISAFQIVHF